MTTPKKPDMTADEIADARRRYAAGESVKSLARSMHRSHETIRGKLRDLPKHAQPVAKPQPEREGAIGGAGSLPAGSPASWGAISRYPWPGQAPTHDPRQIPAETGAVGQETDLRATGHQQGGLEGPVRASAAVLPDRNEPA